MPFGILVILILDEIIVGIAVQPTFAEFARGDDRVTAGVRVFRGVLIG